MIVQNSVRAWVVQCALLGVAATSLAQFNSPIQPAILHTRTGSADEAIKKNAHIGDRIRTVVMVETVEDARELSEQLAAHQATQQATIMDSRDALLRHAVASGESEQRLAEIRANAESSLEIVQYQIQVAEVNAKLRRQRTTLVDVEKQCVRRDDVDLRDLAALADLHGLNSMQRQSMDKAATYISVRSDPEIRLHGPRMGNLATLHAERTLGVDKELIKSA